VKAAATSARALVQTSGPDVCAIEPVMVDLFTGLGGASAAMQTRGWRVITLDVETSFGPSIVADVRALPLRAFRPDLLWASPPCNEFSDAAPRPADHAPSLDLVVATLEAVRQLRPRFWILENVRGALPWLGLAPRSWGPFYLWGYFPPFRGLGRKGLKDTRHVHSPAERARIPYELSRAVAIAVESYQGYCVERRPVARALAARSRTSRTYPSFPGLEETSSRPRPDVRPGQTSELVTVAGGDVSSAGRLGAE